MNTKLHAVTDEKGRPIHFFMTAGAPLTVCLQTSAGQWISGYHADWLRDALKDKGIKPCIPRSEVPQQAGEIPQASL
jgi:transposase